jgi:hypothetical protein
LFTFLAAVAQGSRASSEVSWLAVAEAQGIPGAAAVEASTHDRPTTGLRPLETLGLATAVDTGSAYGWVDGPRPDSVGDTTFFWLDRFGSPQKIVNALGDSTLLARDTIFPALVREAIHPNGFTQRAWYNDRGNVDSVTAEGLYDDGRDATTRYRYTDTTWKDLRVLHHSSTHEPHDLFTSTPILYTERHMWMCAGEGRTRTSNSG